MCHAWIELRSFTAGKRSGKSVRWAGNISIDSVAVVPSSTLENRSWRHGVAFDGVVQTIPGSTTLFRADQMDDLHLFFRGFHTKRVAGVQKPSEVVDALSSLYGMIKLLV
jgi:hypothetical protein